MPRVATHSSRCPKRDTVGPRQRHADVKLAGAEQTKMKNIVIASILTCVEVTLPTTHATADDDYKKICRVNDNMRVLDDDADADSCRAIAVDSQAREYQIGCRRREDSVIIVTEPFSVTDKGARVTSTKLAANPQNKISPEQLAKCAKAWGSR